MAMKFLLLVTFRPQIIQEVQNQPEEKTPFWVYFLWFMIILLVLGILSTIFLTKEEVSDGGSGFFICSVICLTIILILLLFYVVCWG